MQEVIQFLVRNILDNLYNNCDSIDPEENAIELKETNYTVFK